MNISDKALEFLKERRWYVFFPDGSWRTATEEQWKEEQLWKLKPESAWFALSDFDLRIINAVIQRIEMEG